MHEGEQAPPGLSEEDLALIHQLFAAYEASGDAFERARLVSALGKTHAPRLLEEVERLRTENARLTTSLHPLTELLSEGGASPYAVLEIVLAEGSVRDAVRAALQALPGSGPE